MKNRRVLFVVIDIVIFIRNEQRIFKIDTFILCMQSAFIQSNEKGIIHLRHFFCKEHLQQINSLFASIRSSSRRSLQSALRCGFTILKQSDSPHILFLEFTQIVFIVCNCPTYRIGTDIQSQVIILHNLIHNVSSFLTLDNSDSVMYHISNLN